MNRNNWREYLPSKKIQQIIIIILVVGIGILVYWLIDSYESKKEAKSPYLDLKLVQNDTDNNPDEIDTDGDGVPDWLEELWGLDPNNADTDGDGVSDLKYIKNKMAIEQRKQLGVSQDGSSLTESEKLSRSLATAIMAIEQAGGELDEEDRAVISKNVISYINDLTFGDRLYTRDQLKLVDNSKAHSYAYRDSMKKLFTTYPVAASDLSALLQATENPEENQGKLRSRTSKYQEYLKKLGDMDVPYAIAARHTELINNVSQISAALENLLLEDPDEIISLSTVVQIEKIMNQTANAIVKINTYFDIISDVSLFNE